MGKYCSFPACRTGRDAERTKRKRLGVRQASVFKIPKHMLHKWSDAIGHCLSPTDLICELHFPRQSLIRDDRFVMPDGTVEIIPRIKYSLIDDAVPNAIGNKENVIQGSDTGEPRCNRNGTPERELRSIYEGPVDPDNDCPVQEANNANVTPRQSPGFADHLLESSPDHCSSHNEQTVADTTRDIRKSLFGFGDNLMETSTEQTSSEPYDSEWSDGFPIDERDLGDYVSTSSSRISSTINEDSPTSEIEQEEQNVDEPELLTIGKIFRHLKNRSRLPESWSWVKNPREEGSIIFVQIDRYTLLPRVRLILHNDLSLTAQTGDGEVTFEIDEIITSIQRLHEFLVDVGGKMLCCGSGIEKEKRACNCSGFVRETEYTKFVQKPRCCACRVLRKKIQNRLNRRKTDAKVRYARSKHASHLKQRSYRRLQKKAGDFKIQLKRAREECAAVGERALDEAIRDLPPAQQEAVQACLSASRVKISRQRRYSLDWIYECLLMRIKNSKLYEHLRTRNILPLPCIDTLSKYIRKLDIGYGFQKPVFECLRKKASRMEIVDKRGTLLIDEMSLSEAVAFDRKAMKFNGFVNLGEHTPVEQQTVRGDHALVFMFQPFRGTWVQVLGCFLTKNSVTGKTLTKLMLECILLLSGSGFHVDVVTTDGAQWNRGVWTELGIKDGQYSCEHPSDSTRRLWMMSDFPHLIKCLRNGIMNVPSFRTPDGEVYKRHFEALLHHEAYTKPNLSVAHFLTPAHLDPQGYQKMNVPLAFQLFSEKVRVAMELYKDDPKCSSFDDAEPTIRLVKIVGNLIEAMMSRAPADALRPEDTCPHKKAIVDFLQYIRDWEKTAKAERLPFPVSSSTLTGLKVTLGSTLAILEHLHKKGSFDYLMTARLNQDALERFFGMMRNACGSNDHPDPVLFAQVFRLLCTYSLVKPPKGSNVCGTELLETLMQTRESMAAGSNARKEVLDKLDTIIEAGQYSESIDCSSATIVERDHDYLERQSNCSRDHLSTHDYDVVRTSEPVLAYISGYVARKMNRLTKCWACIDTLQSKDSCERDRVVNLINRHDGLVYPSEELFKLTKSLEEAVLDVVGKLTIKANTFHQIVQRVGEMNNLNLVGCIEHEKEMTKRVVSFYLIMRAHFLADSLNKNFDSRKINTKKHRKNAKL